MTIPRETELDLLTACGAAPSAPQRYAATVLLAREMVARLDGSGREYRRASGPQDHPALVDLEGAPTELGLAALLRAGNPHRGGPDAARFYLNWGQPGGPSWGCTVPRTPAPASSYSAALAAVLAGAADLRTAVVAAMGSPAFDAARAPFVAAFALDDFARRAGVARYGVGSGVVGGAVAAGAAYVLESRGRVADGFSELDADSTPEIVVPASGVYRYHFHGTARSSATGNPTTCSVALSVGGSALASFSAVRASSNVEDAVSLGVESYLFLPGTAPTISITGPLTVKNTSANSQTVGGVLLLWQE